MILVQEDGLNRTLSPVVHGDIVNRDYKNTVQEKTVH